MLKRLILCYKLNKFYRIFGDAIGYKPPLIRMRDLYNDDCIMSVGFDIAEAIEAQSDCFYEDSYAMGAWLNKLYKEVIV